MAGVVAWQGLCLATEEAVETNRVERSAVAAVSLYAAANGEAMFAEVPEGTRLMVDTELRSVFLGTNWVGVIPPRHLSVWVYGELASEGKVQVNNTHLRAGAGVKFKSLGQVPKGTELEVRGKMGEWLRVAPPEMARLWVDEAMLREPAEPAVVVVEAPAFEAPAALAGVLLSKGYVQGQAVTLTGVADMPGVREWNTPATATLRVSTVPETTYLLVTTDAAEGFAGARVTVRGTLWWLVAQESPLVVVEELTAHPFSLIGP